jgi:hypothetical protein
MAMTYATYQTALASLMVMQTSDTKFVAILPSVIDYAEQRMYRELDLLNTTVVDGTGTLSAGLRTFTFPQNFSVVEQISSLGVSGPLIRAPLTPVTREVLDAFCGDPSYTGPPLFFAPQTDQIVQVGPFPDGAYRMEVTGKVRPVPLYTSGTTSFLTSYLPDAFLACSMIFASGWQKNFGAQASDPQQGTSWDAQYSALMGSAQAEELRRKWRAAAWSSQSPAPSAAPNREGG